jgi:thioredoxin-related protein
MKYLFSIIFSLFFGNCVAQEPALQFFNGSFDEAVSEAKKHNKPIFIEFGAEWCAPCVKMKKETFTDSQIVNALNGKFLVLKVDVDQFSGMDIADKYKITEFPTYLFLDKTGKTYGQVKGFFPANLFLKEISKNTPKTNQETKKAKKRKLF